MRFAPADAHDALLVTAIGRFDRHGALTFVHVDGPVERYNAGFLAVHVNGRPRHVHLQRQVRDATLQLAEIVLYRSLALGFDGACAVFEVTRQRIARLHILVQLEVTLRNVVEHLEVGLQRVRAFELHQRGVKIAVFVELEALAKVLTRLLDVAALGAGHRRVLGARGERAKRCQTQARA